MDRRSPLLFVLVALTAGCALLAGIETFESAPAPVTEGGAANRPSQPPVATDVIDRGADSEADATADGGADSALASCEGAPQGAQWDPADPWARCCDGRMVRVVDNANCGACGIECNSDRNENCALKGPTYYCTGCADDVLATSTCWSGCCSVSFFSEGVCVPNTCGAQGSTCIESLCNSFGATCRVPGDASNYCGYD